MADPVLDEAAIVEMLKQPMTQETVVILQSAVMQAMLDMYDRKVDRSEFINHGSLCVTTYAMLSRTYMLRSIYELYAAGDLSEARFDKALADIHQLVTRQCEQIGAFVLRMQECPTSADKVH